MAISSSSESGRLIERRCFLLDLKDDPELIAQYEHWHRPGGPPVGISRSIRRAGIIEMEIFRVGNRLAMIIDVAPEYDPAAKNLEDSSNPEVMAWERLMDAFQKPLPWARGDEKWMEAASIYRLSDQPESSS